MAAIYFASTYADGISEDLDAGEVLILKDRSYVTSALGVSGIDVLGNSSDMEVLIEGVVAASGYGVSIGGRLASGVYTSNARVNITETGYVSGVNGVSIKGHHATITNFGTVQGTASAFRVNGEYAEIRNFGNVASNFGVTFTGRDGTYFNSGTMSILNVAVTLGDTATVATIHNTGEIHAGRVGFNLGGRSFNVQNAGTLLAEGRAGIYIAQNGIDGQIRNSGEISGGFAGVETAGLNGQIYNTGLITGDSHGIYLSAETDRGFTVIRNEGSIAGGRTSVRTDGRTEDDEQAVKLINGGTLSGDVELSSRSDVLRNSGTIHGDVNLGASGDRLVNSGLIDGYVDLGDGSDHFSAETGRVTGNVLGGSGKDRIEGSHFADSIYGGADSDTLTGFSGDDRIEGGTGQDFIFGGAGDDTIFAQTVITANTDDGSLDVLYGGAGNDHLFGANGHSSLHGGSGDDRLDGGSGSEWLEGGRGDDRISGQNGNDTLQGGSGEDQLRGMRGNDELLGNFGDDLLEGSGGDDMLQGNSGDDTLEGNIGDDRLEGGHGDDILVGGAGMDELLGGRGNDVLTGGADLDTFFFGAGQGHDTITDYGTGGDGLVLLSHLWGGGLTKAEVFDQFGTVQGDNFIFDFENGNSLTLLGVGELNENSVVIF